MTPLVDLLLVTLLDKLADGNTRIREACKKGVDLLASATCVGAAVVAGYLLRPLPPKLRTAWRPIWVRLHLLSDIIAVHGLGAASGLTVELVMTFVKVHGAFAHSNGEVREAAKEVTVTLQRLVGAARLESYLSGLRPKQKEEYLAAFEAAGGARAVGKAEVVTSSPSSPSPSHARPIPNPNTNNNTNINNNVVSTPTFKPSSSASGSGSVSSVSSSGSNRSSRVNPHQSNPPSNTSHSHNHNHVVQSSEVGRVGVSVCRTAPDSWEGEEEVEEEDEEEEELHDDGGGGDEGDDSITGETSHHLLPQQHHQPQQQQKDFSCNFCGAGDKAWTEDILDAHYLRDCPLLAPCPACGQVHLHIYLHPHMHTHPCILH